MKIIQDIEANSTKVPIAGCWIWGKAIDRKGYGQIWDGGRARFAHRVAFEAANGIIPKDMHILHRCDNPSCVNPNHLFAGANSDNMKDRDMKGRQARQYGIKNGKAKLTDIQISEIKNSQSNALYLSGLYKVSCGHIRQIKSGRRRNGVGPCVA